MRNLRSLIALLSLVYLLIGCSKQESQSEEIIRPVRYEPVYVTGGERTRVFTGVARSGIESKLSFKVAGTVKSIAVKVGDKVKPGWADILQPITPVAIRIG